MSIELTVSSISTRSLPSVFIIWLCTDLYLFPKEHKLLETLSYSTLPCLVTTPNSQTILPLVDIQQVFVKLKKITPG